MTTHTENRKLSAWIGSVLFHTVLLLLVLLWFSLSTSSDRGAPGVRNVAGTIILQPSGGGQQQAEETTNSEQQAVAEDAVEWERFGTINLSALSVTPALAPGQDSHATQTGTQAGGASAADLAASLQQSGVGRSNLQGMGTGETTVQVFGLNGTGTKFMYVFDHSLSMEGTQIRAAKAELLRSLDSLGDSHQFNIIFYNNLWQLWRPPERGRQLVFATAANKQGATRFVNAITAEGGTRHYEPLIEAIRHRPDVIFFLTDGESQDDLRRVELNAIERENSLGQMVQINVIQFGRGGFTDSPSSSLQQLAEQNRGQYRYENVLRLR